MRILQDFKLINGDGVGEILLELHFPEGALVEKAVNDRMANHFDNKGAQGVRVIDSDTGKVITNKHGGMNEGVANLRLTSCSSQFENTRK